MVKGHQCPCRAPAVPRHPRSANADLLAAAQPRGGAGPVGLGGQSRDRRGVDARQPQSAMSAAPLHYPSGAEHSTNSCPLHASHGTWPCECQALLAGQGGACHCVQQTARSGAISSLLQQVTNLCSGRTANGTLAAARIPCALGQQTVASARGPWPGRDLAQQGAGQQQHGHGKRSQRSWAQLTASDAAHRKASSSSHPSPGLRFGFSCLPCPSAGHQHMPPACLAPWGQGEDELPWSTALRTRGAQDLERQALRPAGLRAAPGEAPAPVAHCRARADLVPQPGRSFCPSALKCSDRVPRQHSNSSAQSKPPL